MTTLIQQKSPNDCVLATIAMAAGKEKWEDVWTQEDLDKVIASKGIADLDPWMEKAGLGKPYVDYWEYSTYHLSDGAVKVFLWKRRAIISCRSLNNDGGHHSVYWDGEKLFDPHTGHEDQGFQAFKWLSTLNISRVFLFAT